MEEKKSQEPGATSENMPAWREVFLYFLMLGFIKHWRTCRPDLSMM